MDVSVKRTGRDRKLVGNLLVDMEIVTLGEEIKDD